MFFFAKKENRKNWVSFGTQPNLIAELFVYTKQTN